MDNCIVVAEAGNSHQGDYATAERMVIEASRAGADVIKFQRRHNRALYTREYYRRAYENENSFGRTYGEHRETLELGRADLERLREVCRQYGIGFACTAFDPWSVDDLQAIGVDFIKIASGDLTNPPLIAHAAATGLPLVLSTGGGSWAAVRQACEAAADARDLTVLQCTASYPARYEDLNLAVIPQMICDFAAEGWMGVKVGASLHVNGIAMALAAYMLGATMIEQHFTLDRSMKGTDHAFSLEPQGLRKLVRDIRRAQAAYGDPIKRGLECELPALQKMSKACYANRALPIGHMIELEDIAFKSPGDGYAPAQVHLLTGRRLTRNLMTDDPITEDVLECATSKVSA